jgi:hypothetical protein
MTSTEAAGVCRIHRSYYTQITASCSPASAEEVSVVVGVYPVGSYLAVPVDRQNLCRG